MDKLTKLKNRASVAHELWGKIRGERAELVRRQKELRNEADEFKREGAAFALLPEHERPTPDWEPVSRRSAIDAELEHIGQVEVEAEVLKDAAHEALQAEVRRLFPAAIEAVQEANAEVRKRLADLGQAPVQPYLEYLGAEAVLHNADAALASLTAQLGGSDRRAIGREKNEVRSLLDAGLTDASDVEILGQIVASIIRWSRRGSSPIEDLWTAEGLPVLPGSVLNNPPNVGDVLVLRTRRLPRRAS